MRILNLSVAGMEYIKRIIALYRTINYRQDKTTLGSLLITSAVEAGRFTCACANARGDEKSTFAVRALDNLNRATYIITAMEHEGYYDTEKVKYVLELSADMEDSLKDCLTDEVYTPSVRAYLADSNVYDASGFSDPYIDDGND